MIISNNYYKSILNKYPNLNKSIIEKDLILSYILKELSGFENLIFKGGTCLSKGYLNYHRLSEDLDFTLEFKHFKSLTNKRNSLRKYFKNTILPILQNIANKYNFDFDETEFNKQETRYCPVKRPDNVFRANIYNNKDSNNPIKIEINISENLLYPTKKIKISQLIDNSNYLTYPLTDFYINSYSIEEIILEKIRAILTRKEGIHERDIFDLFLIDKNIQNIFNLDKEKLLIKIKNSFLYDAQALQKRITNLFEYKLFEEIYTLSLIDFNKEDYINFFNNLKEFIGKLNNIDFFI